MDPNAAFDAMTAAWRADDYRAAHEYADGLRTWIADGGFKPERPDACYFIGQIFTFYAGARNAS